MACNVTQLAKSRWQLVFFNLHMIEIPSTPWHMWAYQRTQKSYYFIQKNLRKLQILSPRQYGWFSQQWLLLLASLCVLTSERYYFNSHQSYPRIMPRRRKLGVDCGSEWTKGVCWEDKGG